MPLISALSVGVLTLPAPAISKPPERRVDAAPVGGVPLELAVQPASPTPGQAVRLDVGGAPAGATDYRWDVNGSGTYTIDTGAVAVTTATFTSTGAHRVGVEIETPAGVERVGAIVNVVPAAAARSAVRSGHSHRAARSRAADTPRHAVAAPAKTHVARASGDPGVTIADFNFTPGSTTVHAGETVTWVNNGPSPHSATANNGSFNTGVLQKGQSGSHTFTQAGTFTYFCSVHPFMHGTIVVLASTQTTGSQSTGSSGGGSQSSSTSPSSSGSTSGSTSGAATGSSTTPATATPTAASTTSSSATLPLTGMSIIAAVVTGLGLLGLGLAVRRLVVGR